MKLNLSVSLVFVGGFRGSEEFRFCAAGDRDMILDQLEFSKTENLFSKMVPQRLKIEIPEPKSAEGDSAFQSFRI